MIERRRTSGFTLVEILVVIVIIAIIATIVIPMYTGRRTAEGTVVKSPVSLTKDTVCQTYVSQVRQGIAVYKTTDVDGGNPPDLASLRLGDEVTHCPVGKEPYLYDPVTATVRCPHPGHESY